MASNTTYDGGCLCGSVHFRAVGTPKWILWCHCQSCRRHGGAPVAAFGAFDEAARLAPTGEIFVGERLPWVHLGEPVHREPATP